MSTKSAKAELFSSRYVFLFRSAESVDSHGQRGTASRNLHVTAVSRLVNRVALQIAMSHVALFPFRGGSIVTANVLRSVRTVESGPLLVDATTAAALCGKHLRTWRAWQAAGRIPGPIRIGRSLMWRFSELEAWVAAGGPLRKDWVFTGRTGRRMP